MGAVGGAILIGALALLVFLKKRNKKVTNQLPNFADEALSSDNEKATGFLKIFGAKGGAAATGGGGVSTYNGLENQVNVRASGAGAAAAAAAGDNDFEYRGVTNSNNLDSVFRTSGGNTGVNSTGHASAAETPRQHSRYNSMIVPGMGTMHEAEPTDQPAGQPAEAPYPTQDDDVHSALIESEKSSDYGTDDDFLFHEEPHLFWTNEHHSNNSRLRFTEDLA